MCDCNKVVSQSDCQRVLELKALQSSFDGFFIYTVDSKGGLVLISVKRGENPNKRVKDLGYLDENNEPKWFYLDESPCLNKSNNK